MQVVQIIQVLQPQRSLILGNDMPPDQTTIDPTALALSRAIRQAEGGDYKNTGGDNGTSAGAYQWNNGKLPIKAGDTPANFKSAALRHGLNPDDFSEENQDHVAYEEINHDLKNGLTQSQIAAKWNSGLTQGWENHRGPVTINGKTIHYDTPAYVDKVKKFYQKEMDGTSTVSQAPNTDSSGFITSANLPPPPPPDPTKDLKAPDSPTIGKLWQGLGYAGSNLMGTQDDLIKTQNEGSQIHEKIIQQIKQDKAQGKDTSKLEAALSALGDSLNTTASQVSDVGTGGITNNQVLKSAVQNAVAIPSAISGAGLIGKALQGANVLSSPAIESALGRFKMTLPEFKTLSNAEKLDFLTEASSKASGSERLVLQKAIEKVTPLAAKELGLAPSMLKKVLFNGGGLVGGLIKGAARSAVGYSVGAQGSKLIDKFIK